MKAKLILALTPLFVMGALNAQQFETKFKVALPDSIIHAEISWTDLDNDSLLDVLVLAADTNQRQFLLTYKSDVLKGLIWQSVVETDIINGSYLIADADLDNDMDVILSGDSGEGPATVLWRNNGGFSFESSLMINRSGSVVKMADLDLDGEKELILSGKDKDQAFLTFYKNTGSQWYAHDSLKIEVSTIEVFDFDNDGDNDFFVSGRDENDLITTSVFYNEHDFQFSQAVLNTRIDGLSSSADVDHNGYFDLIISGIDSTNKSTTVVLINDDGVFRAVKDTLMVLDHAVPFAADFDNNGKCDLNLYGINSSADTINVILNDRKEAHFLNYKGLKKQVFGDFNRDGNPDLLQLLKSTSILELAVVINKTDSVNKGPDVPFNLLGTTIFDRLFLYWDKPADDHTPTEAITYDLTLQAVSNDLIVGDYDLIHSTRLTVSHGNNGNRNYALLRGEGSTATTFSVQSVDNAFNSGSGPKGSGSGPCTSCAEFNTDYFQLCKNEQLSFASTGNALWFSFSSGFLGQYDVFEFKAHDADTIFSFLPGGAGCSSIRVYVIEIIEKLVRETETLKYVCEGQQFELGVEPEWETVEWKSALTGFLSGADTIAHTVVKNDTISVKLDDGSGCQLKRNTVLMLSKPEVTTNGETFQVLKGEQVQLYAKGGETYFWVPSAGLNIDNIPNPISTPLRTTEYIVTVSDSVGCEAKAKILVVVETTAFIPNLFTPNEDGKNDVLKVYGLEPVDNFSFTIHNREGSVVYQTNNVTDAVSNGWNGTVQGSKQPSGIYYWQVKGEYGSGRRVLLNGKSSGSVVLVR